MAKTKSIVTTITLSQLSYSNTITPPNARAEYLLQFHVHVIVFTE
jgi:hypothetical protein